MTTDELKKRTKQFALRVIRLVRALPKTVEGRAIGGQLMRCGTSVGANYRSACRARSRADFVAKMAIVEEEADEAAYWIELVTEARLLPDKRMQPLLDEASQLVAIASASRKSARRAVRSSIDNRHSTIDNGSAKP
jgi:four helix bundle protein